MRYSLAASIFLLALSAFSSPVFAEVFQANGIKIGEVISIRLLFDQDTLTFRIPVLIAIEPDRIELSGELAIPEYKVVEKLVGKGLRAQQRTASGCSFKKVVIGSTWVCDVPFRRYCELTAINKASFL